MPDPVYLSIVEIPGDGVTTQHEFNFAGGYLDRAHVKAQIYDAVGGLTTVTVTDAMFVNDYTLNLGVAAPIGGYTRIYRETPRDLPLVDFSGGARVTETNLDTMTRQAILAVAEAFDAGAYAAVNDLLGAAATSAATASAAAAASSASQTAAAASASSASDSAASAAASAATATTAATSPAVVAAYDNLAAITAAPAAATAAADSAAAALASQTAAGISASAAAEDAADAAASAVLASGYAAAPVGSYRNRLINGDFSQNVRALTSVADDTYCLDRWYILTETGSVTVAQLTDPESGAPFGIRLTQPDASPKRMGFAQIIESKNLRQYASRAMHLAARLRLSTGDNIRYAVIEHTGTADVVTSDVVNNWSSATFTPSNFFIPGLNILSTGTITPGAATWGDVSAWAALGSSVKNVIVFIWTESQVAQNVTLDCSRAQYEPGVVATPHEWRMDEGRLCRRYTRLNSGGSGISTSATSLLAVTVSFDDPMRQTPAVSVFDGTVALLDPGIAFRTLSSISTNGVTANGGYLDLVSSGMTASRMHVLIPDKVLFTAEL